MAEPASKQDEWQRLYGFVLGNQASWVIDVGLKAGLFKAVADAGEGGIAETALAERLGYFPRYVAVWCRAAYAFSLLDWDEATGYRLAPHMADLLLNEMDPSFIGGRMQFFTSLYEDYLAFPDSLRTGRVWPRSEHDPWLLQALKNMTKPDAVVLTDHVLPQAPGALAALDAGGALLEIGPGVGTRSRITRSASRMPAWSGSNLTGPASIWLEKRWRTPRFPTESSSAMATPTCSTTTGPTTW